MESAIIKIAGMTCMGCVRSVTNVLQALPGVNRAEVSLERGEAKIDFEAGQVDAAAMKAAVVKAGFEAP
ncbi:MAG: heavy-metal-associated domain-containing protein [Rhodocyclaceae bacterium]|jgi:copper chaperone|nr:MAG: heavy-metal-associated domain-containing protein [Rhodocyclaceae bacterium]